MAQIALRNCTIKLCDGRLATATLLSSNAALTYTDKSKHRGSRPAVTVRYVNPGTPSASLSVSVGGDLTTDITVNLATDGSSAITSTANQIKTAIEANSTANALVTITVPGTGASVVTAVAETPLATGARTLTAKIGDGTIQWVEKYGYIYLLEKDVIDGVKTDEDQPLEVNLDAVLEFLIGETGSGTPTFSDVLKNRGEASNWVTTATDTCEPYCIDIEVLNDPDCSPTLKEYIVFECFRYEKYSPSLKNSTISVSGKCNVVAPRLYRTAG